MHLHSTLKMHVCPQRGTGRELGGVHWPGMGEMSSRCGWVGVQATVPVPHNIPPTVSVHASRLSCLGSSPLFGRRHIMRWNEILQARARVSSWSQRCASWWQRWGSDCPHFDLCFNGRQFGGRIGGGSCSVGALLDLDDPNLCNGMAMSLCGATIGAYQGGGVMIEYPAEGRTASSSSLLR